MHPHTTDHHTDTLADDRDRTDVGEYGDATERSEDRLDQYDDSRHDETPLDETPHDEMRHDEMRHDEESRYGEAAGVQEQEHPDNDEQRMLDERTDHDATAGYQDQLTDADGSPRHGDHDVADGVTDHTTREPEFGETAGDARHDTDWDGTPGHAEPVVDERHDSDRDAQFDSDRDTRYDTDRDAAGGYVQPGTDLDGAPGYGEQPTDHDATPAYAQPDGQFADEAVAGAATGAALGQQTERPPQPDDDWVLFGDQDTTALRARWAEVQGTFVDDPRDALNQAEQLVGELVQSLTDRFNERKNALHLHDVTDTEELRLAIRRYRTFFQQLLGS